MTRTKTLAFLGVLVAQGCIIYEDKPHHWSCGEEPCPDSGWTGGGTTTPVAEPQPDLRLTVAEGLPGQQLLSTLVNAGEHEVDLLGVETVSFARDVAVMDLIHRTDEVVLLLAIGAEALPGEVDVWVSGNGGAGWILEQPFTVLGEEDACTSGNGGTGTTTDTACP